MNFTIQGNLSKFNKYGLIYQEPIFVFIFVLNIFFAITATLGNTLILIALQKVSSIHPPTRLFLRCLTVTDFCVGVVVHPLFATSLTQFPSGNEHILSLTVSVFSFTFSGLSFLTSAAISVDRLLALLLGLRYRLVVTLRRVRIAVVCLWFSGILNGLLYSFYSPDVGNSVAFVFTTISVFISVFSYTKIFLKLRQHQFQVQQNAGHEQVNDVRIPLNIERYKKIVYSIAWVQLALFVCYSPIVLYMILRTSRGNTDPGSILLNSALTIAYFNSSLNPILYCWKIRDIRQTVKNTVKHIFNFSG
ncbi:PREDICTED: octopamine receptor beta-1R-like [Acropora digitifera]|uniref:octopamine receptor beta-1R-like n=1 Tax=Acropora digitifera TaxID=70779 RepID=UPI00077AD6F0|nr:PREDICTED: octopamine receptor beta-1R-like [Acropora digitifera]